jgi:hypothetical protein
VFYSSRRYSIAIQLANLGAEILAVYEKWLCKPADKKPAFRPTSRTTKPEEGKTRDKKLKDRQVAGGCPFVSDGPDGHPLYPVADDREHRNAH